MRGTNYNEVAVILRDIFHRVFLLRSNFDRCGRHLFTKHASQPLMGRFNMDLNLVNIDKI